MSAAELRERVTFEKRADLSDNSPPGDGYGNVEGGWEEQFTVYARMTPRLGGEEVMAARLSGRKPVTIKVRHSSYTVQITTDWRARDVRSGTVYNIRSIANIDERKRYLDILAEEGVAT